MDHRDSYRLSFADYARTEFFRQECRCEYIDGDVSLGIDPELQDSEQILEEACFVDLIKINEIDVKPTTIKNLLVSISSDRNYIINMGLDDLSNMI